MREAGIDCMVVELLTEDRTIWLDSAEKVGEGWDESLREMGETECP